MGIALTFLQALMDKNLLKLYPRGTHLVCELYSWVLQYKNISIHQKWLVVGNFFFAWVIVGTFVLLSVLLNLLWEILILVSHGRSTSLPWL